LAGNRKHPQEKSQQRGEDTSVQGDQEEAFVYYTNCGISGGGQYDQDLVLQGEAQEE
jgi:hypothetical protein